MNIKSLAYSLALSALSQVALADMADVSNNFALTMLKSVSAQKSNQNVVISPTSLNSAFLMVLAGAGKADQALVLKSLGYKNATIAEALEDNKKFESGLVKSEGYSVSSQNALFTNVSLDSQYKTLIENNLAAKTSTIDFSKSGASALINQWADQSTQGMIKEIVKDKEIQELAFLGLNATFLDAKWAYAKFDSPSEHGRDFLNEKGEVVGKVKLMVSNPKIRIAKKEYDKFTAYEVPYTLDDTGNAKGSMIVLLPKITNAEEYRKSMWSENKIKPNIIPLSEVLESLTGESISQMSKDLAALRLEKNVRPLLFNMPKFKVETEVGEELKTMVSNLGASSIFGNIDMSPMVENNFKALWSTSKIKLIKQKTVIEVGEEGTKAAAVSAIGGFPESCPPPSVVLNRPFAYLVKDNASGRIVFAGNFVAPN
ncbi:MAG: hypothetical protein A4S09_10215 [Proteobacteria bacterium SG_bin7]|nr:MAG: hypothetical protein A4S09_10215 [Proteobacteria bacterium SG_bin7]